MGRGLALKPVRGRKREKILLCSATEEPPHCSSAPCPSEEADWMHSEQVEAALELLSRDRLDPPVEILLSHLQFLSSFSLTVCEFSLECLRKSGVFFRELLPSVSSPVCESGRHVAPGNWSFS